MNCCICGDEIEAVGDWTQGNNAEPVADGRCCGPCNTGIVIPARLVVAGFSYAPRLRDTDAGPKRDWYWQDGTPYCPGCVECDTPALDPADAIRGPAGSKTTCACCGGKDGDR